MKAEKIFLPFLIAMFLLLPDLCGAEFYLGGYLGPNFVANTDVDFEFGHNVDAERVAKNVSVSPAIIFGGKIGYWFTREGASGFQFPAWMKYLGFELDLSYHELNWPNQNVQVSPLSNKFNLQKDGLAFTSAFMFMGRYGFLPDSQAPFGRLQPYVGIGPIIFVNKVKVNLGRDFRTTDADLGFGVETGLRYMVLKHVSVFSAFRYRYARSHNTVDDQIFDLPNRFMNMRTTYQLFSFIFGAAYHF